MSLTKEQVKEITELFKAFDVKKIDLTESFSADRVKYHRFGAYNGLQIACNIVKLLEEKEHADSSTETSK